VLLIYLTGLSNTWSTNSFIIRPRNCLLSPRWGSQQNAACWHRTRKFTAFCGDSRFTGCSARIIITKVEATQNEARAHWWYEVHFNYYFCTFFLYTH